ncbi:hypothetical protein P168DRAFT_303293 [Aspergillus campestris IBT 28561]|uniref:Uncharacterized protein n=1 Tax=Aspergillus campestris (strain IBT 28561) TaxID=1392248 RepID=A0A2I1D6M3_ASPC2|nr:uncharacterized protein P168DRAFT_303293 [Aspergillus campestris IBT 28561]PKY05503.1 hypothetical protein P168DRAFT_303293 [Aspergillus campestris IBT 28561]
MPPTTKSLIPLSPKSLPKTLCLTEDCSAKPPTKMSSIPVFTVPPGWTTDRADDFYADWEDTNARGQTVAHAYGLGPGQPIMEDDDGLTQIFLSGNKFYLWDEMNDEIYEIVTQDIREIADVLGYGGQGGLNKRPLDQVGELAR